MSSKLCMLSYLFLLYLVFMIAWDPVSLLGTLLCGIAGNRQVEAGNFCFPDEKHQFYFI